MKRRWIFLLLAWCAMLNYAFALEWEYLFNGSDLNGWKTTGDQEWGVKDGAITVKGTGQTMGFLYYDQKEYSDFVLHLRFKWQGGNSGVQFRTKLEEDKMVGYQANIDPSRDTATGALVEEYGRGLLKKNTVTADEIFKKDDWNHLEITAIGARIYIYVNGTLTTALNDPEGGSKGIIALQMDPAPGAYMEWTDIRVLEIPNQTMWSRLFNGKNLTGWKPLADATWSVEDGVLVGASNKGGYGWLLSEKEYSNFYFVTLFKIDAGNSGIQFRSWPVDNMVHGYQADLAVGSDWISGHLYEQSTGRNSLAKPAFDVRKIIDWDGWNTYEITAIGPNIDLFINGVKTVSYTEKELVNERTKGIFAFQIHQGPPMKTWWKDIRIIELP